MPLQPYMLQNLQKPEIAPVGPLIFPDDVSDIFRPIIAITADAVPVLPTATLPLADVISQGAAKSWPTSRSRPQPSALTRAHQRSRRR